MAFISAALRLAGTIGAIGGESAAAGTAVRSAGQVGATTGDAGNLKELKEKAENLGRSAQNASAHLVKMTSTMINAVHPLTHINKGLDLFKTGLDSVLGPLDHFVGFFQELNSKYVGLFDPARVKLFDMATRDLYAVIGEQLSPITREATAVIKEMSAMLNGLTPMVKEFVNAGLKEMQPAIRAVIDLTKEYIAASRPLLDIAAEIQLAQWQGLAWAIKEVADGTQVWYKWLREILGLPEFQPKDAMGKAAANVSQTNTQGYLTNLQLGALKMGKGEDPAVKQVNLLGDIKQELINLIANLPDKIKAGVAELPAAIGKAVMDSVKGKAEIGVAVAGNVIRNQIPAFVGG